jgi:hypothetical protein
MQQFVPFEDDWDAYESMRPGALVPYRIGLVCAREPAGALTRPAGPMPRSTRVLPLVDTPPSLAAQAEGSAA